MQYASRREARAAEAARSAAQVGSELELSPAAAIVAPAASVSVSVESHTVSAPWAQRPAAKSASRPVARAAASAAPARKTRKNPVSVLATMAVVGGLFAVAGLPAYAVTDTDSASLATTAAPKTVESQSISVLSDVAAASPIRDVFSATTPEALAQSNADAIRAAQNAAYLASGAREAGDDYPWPFELTDDQGGGLSPLNYYYRECVDFVAWRLNRDAGSYSAPFKYVWSNLTPYGGNGGQWLSNWQALGRTVSNVPIAGAVAYTGGNHVAYVNSVNADGTVNLEEYNFIPGVYSKRTIPASSVVAFLYPPG